MAKRVANAAPGDEFQKLLQKKQKTTEMPTMTPPMTPESSMQAAQKQDNIKKLMASAANDTGLKVTEFVKEFIKATSMDWGKAMRLEAPDLTVIIHAVV